MRGERDSGEREHEVGRRQEPTPENIRVCYRKHIHERCSAAQTGREGLNVFATWLFLTRREVAVQRVQTEEKSCFNFLRRFPPDYFATAGFQFP